jgi:ABC-type transport system substrate-binding protein
MRLTAFRLIVISSLMICGAAGATRPHYGGTLRVQIAASVSSLDPAVHSGEEAAQNVFPLIFDTLIAIDNHGKPQPALAISWEADAGSQRWQFVLRPGVTFSDGTAMTPEAVAACLRRTNPGWKVQTTETAVVIQLDGASVDLPAELALPRNSIAAVNDGKIAGTGAFVVAQWDPGKKLVLSARDDYWGGRAFLDSVEIEMGRNFRDQTIAFDLGQAQVIEVPPEQAHHAKEAGQLRASEPVELAALLFAREIQSAEDAKQRQALAMSIDRELLNRVALQGGGEPAGGLLPNWLTGYSFLFPVTPDLTRAQQLRAEIPRSTLWSLGLDQNDPLSRLLAERIVLNAGDAGLRLQIVNQVVPDIRLVRVRLASTDAHIALMELAKSLGISPPKFLGNSADDLYHAENAMLQSQRVIPLLDLRTAWAVSKTVRDWKDAPDGTWHLPDVWLAAGKP